MPVDSPAPSASVQGHQGLHPIWIGAIALSLLTSSLVILIGFAVFRFEWQRQFGSWNIWIGVALAISTVIPLRFWTTSTHKA